MPFTPSVLHFVDKTLHYNCSRFISKFHVYFVCFAVTSVYLIFCVVFKQTCLWNIKIIRWLLSFHYLIHAALHTCYCFITCFINVQSKQVPCIILYWAILSHSRLNVNFKKYHYSFNVPFWHFQHILRKTIFITIP